VLSRSKGARSKGARIRRNLVLKYLRNGQKLWLKAGMRYKIKAVRLRRLEHEPVVDTAPA
jgi:hypothetical protein